MGNGITILKVTFWFQTVELLNTIFTFIYGGGKPKGYDLTQDSALAHERNFPPYQSGIVQRWFVGVIETLSRLARKC